MLKISGKMLNFILAKISTYYSSRLSNKTMATWRSVKLFLLGMGRSPGKQLPRPSASGNSLTHNLVGSITSDFTVIKSQDNNLSTLAQ